MIPVGQPYRAAGPIEIQSVLVTMILGTVTAIFGAGLIWLWESSPIPTLVLLTPIIHGVIVGSAFSFMVGRLQMRNPRLVGAVAFVCGLLSIGLVHFGHHYRLTSAIASEMRQDVASEPTLSDAEKQRLLKSINTDPVAAADRFLVKRTGSSGLLGSLKLRNEIGVHLKRTHVTGAVLWGLWGVEALIVAVTASALASSAAGKPYCEDCGYWCHHQPNVLVLPMAHSQPVLEAVRTDDLELAWAVRNQPSADDGNGRVEVSLHACPQCEQSFSDVSLRVKRGNSMKVTVLTKHLRISPEMAGTLATSPTAAADPTPVPAATPEDNATLHPEA